jgi:hypothetical protein
MITNERKQRPIKLGGSATSTPVYTKVLRSVKGCVTISGFKRVGAVGVGVQGSPA